MKDLPVKSLEDIRKLNPCYDPGKYAPVNWQGTVLDVLKAEQVPAADRIWLVCHKGWIDDRTLRMFACWCAREALARIDNPDPRSINAVEVAERYANGKATKIELYAARDAAWDAAWAADRAAAWAAARAADREADREAQVKQLIKMLEE